MDRISEEEVNIGFQGGIVGGDAMMAVIEHYDTLLDGVKRKATMTVSEGMEKTDSLVEKAEKVERKVRDVKTRGDATLDQLKMKALIVTSQIKALASRTWSIVQQTARASGETIDPMLSSIITVALALVEYILGMIASFAAQGPYGILGVVLSTIALGFAINAQIDAYKATTAARDAMKKANEAASKRPYVREAPKVVNL